MDCCSVGARRSRAVRPFTATDRSALPMTSQRLGLAVVALLGVLVASAGPSPRPVVNHPARLAGANSGGQLMVFGGRSAEQMARGIGGKMDATLADLATHLGRVRADHALEDLH